MENIFTLKGNLKNKNILLLLLILILLFILFIKIYKKNKIENIIIDKYSMLKLYFENKTKFYILGRQKIMEKIGSSYNESNIITVQDKMNWLLIHESPEYKTKIVDKILLREYAKKILRKEICPRILKIYDNVDNINLKELPKKFILKCNHGSGMNIFCRNKYKFNLTLAKTKLKKWMKINYGMKNFEYVYINIKKKIFAEEYLSDDMGIYKIDCYNGKPKFIRAYKKLPKQNYKIGNIYDLNWNLTDIETGLRNIKRDPNITFKKPKRLKKMLEYSKKLSKEFAFVRVDFYTYNNKIYLSELTFTTSNIKMPYRDKEQSIYLGKFLDITKIKNFSYI